MHRDDLIIATLREQRCTACNEGVFRFESALSPELSKGARWLHRCSNRHCTETLESEELWPQIIYRGKKFLLPQAVPHPDKGKVYDAGAASMLKHYGKTA